MARIQWRHRMDRGFGPSLILPECLHLIALRLGCHQAPRCAGPRLLQTSPPHPLLRLLTSSPSSTLQKIDMACEVCEATYEWGRTEESRMLIVRTGGKATICAAWAAKKCPRASGAAMPVSNSKEYIIPGWAAGLSPFWGRGLCVVGGALTQPALCGMRQQIPMHPLALHGPKCPPEVVLRPLGSPQARWNTGDPGAGGLLRSQNWP